MHDNFVTAPGPGVEAAQTLFRNGTAILLFSISWPRTFTCVWYFNFMIFISLMSFLLDKYISSLIFVYLENACQVYILLFPCLPYYFFWNSVQNWDNPIPTFMAYYHQQSFSPLSAITSNSFPLYPINTII